MNYRRIPFMSRLGAYTAPLQTDYDIENIGTEDAQIGAYDSLSASTGFLSGPDKTTVVLRPKAGAARGWTGFMGWVAATHPAIYNYLRASNGDAVQAIEQGRVATQGGYGVGDISADQALADSLATPTVAAVAPDTSTGATLAQFAQTAVNAASAMLPVYQQQQIFNLQLSRAKAGLPPLDTSNLTANSGLQFGINTSTQKVLLIGVALLGAFYVLPKLLKR
jgi:hypothetical protein